MEIPDARWALLTPIRLEIDSRSTLETTLVKKKNKNVPPKSKLWIKKGAPLAEIEADDNILNLKA